MILYYLSVCGRSNGPIRCSFPSLATMARRDISPFVDAGSDDFERSRRPNPPLVHSSSLPLPGIPPHRSSVFSSPVFPSLRRPGPGEIMNSHLKTPLLTLKLSSPSFLDSVVHDDLTKHPLYTIRTIGTSTIITRSDPWEGSSNAADIKWPKVLPVKGKGKETDGVSIRMRGAKWKGSESLLRPGTFMK